MSGEHKAVFLSYASQDAEAAKRICDALRQAGVEVWFDQSELRGGDAWDAMIRKRIKECALFVPVISVNTNARAEGYFRLEWKLAVDRSHLMADDAHFIFPVVVGDVVDATARVPEKFREVQWTRLRLDETPTELAARVARLLSGGEPEARSQRSEDRDSRRRRRDRRGIERWWWMIFPLFGMAMALIPMLKSDGRPERAEKNAPPAAPAPATPGSSDARPYIIGSVGVLPFKLITDTPELRSEAEALHEEMLTQLSEMKALDVVSRTSTLRYGGSPAGVREIGRELGADFIVEGSVQLAGAQQRLTLQVIEAATDRHLWAQTFDRNPQPDEDPLVFQKERAFELAIGIYRALWAKRPPSGAVRERRDKIIGDLTAKARDLEARFWGRDGHSSDRSVYDQLLELENQIIAVDPDNRQARSTYAAILGQGESLGKMPAGDPDWNHALYLALRRSYLVHLEDRVTLEQLGVYYLGRENRAPEAIPYLQKSLAAYEAEVQAGTSGKYNWPYLHLARALTQTGQTAAALRLLQRMPNEPDALQITAYWMGAYTGSRRWEEAIAFLSLQLNRLEKTGDRRAVLQVARERAQAEAIWTGSRAPLAAFYAQIKDDPAATPGFKATLLFSFGEYAAANNFFSSIDPGSDPDAPTTASLKILQGVTLARSGNPQLASSYFRSLLNESRSSRDLQRQARFFPTSFHASTACLQAFVGEKDAAAASIARAEQAMDATRNLEEYYNGNWLIALAYEQLGDTRACCAKIDLLLSGPTGNNSTGEFIAMPLFDRLRTSPEFEAVLRKHADQLKDPAILDTYFAKKQ